MESGPRVRRRFLAPKPPSAFFFLGVPSIYGSMLSYLIHLVRSGQHERIAWALCHFFTTCMVFLPFSVVAVNGLFFRASRNRAVQLCAVHFCWNSHLILPAVSVSPFLAHKRWVAPSERYGEVLYDALCFVLFVCGPVVVCTGVLKGVVSKRKARFSWRHRAALGTSCLVVFLCYLAGTLYVRPETFWVTVSSAAGFYFYTLASYLPSNPQGDGPEITGAREWPYLRTFLRPFLWDPIYEYMQMEVVMDEAARPSRTSSRTGSSTDLRTRGERDAEAAKTLRRAEEAVREALRHLEGLDATAEVRRLSQTLDASADSVARCALATADGARGTLREGEAVVMGFHTHGIIPFNTGLMTYGDAWAKQIAPVIRRCVVATDAFTHVVPWMRDLGQWLGARECTRLRPSSAPATPRPPRRQTSWR